VTACPWSIELGLAERDAVSAGTTLSVTEFVVCVFAAESLTTTKVPEYDPVAAGVQFICESSPLGPVKHPGGLFNHV
jgi:hypothetical protein